MDEKIIEEIKLLTEEEIEIIKQSDVKALVSEDLLELMNKAGDLVGEKIVLNKDKMMEMERFYFDFPSNDTTKISYIPIDRLYRFDGNYYDTELRKKYAVMSSLDKNFPAMCGKNVSLLYRGVFNAIRNRDEYDIEFLEGDKIGEAYRDGIGGGSCMTGAFPNETFRIYEDHGKMMVGCKKKVYTWDKVSRAIVFDECTIEFKNGEKVKAPIMQRVYYRGSNETARGAMFLYCIENNIAFYLNGVVGSEYIMYDGKIYNTWKHNNNNSEYGEATVFMPIKYNATERYGKYGIPYIDNISVLHLDSHGDYFLCSLGEYKEADGYDGYQCTLTYTGTDWWSKADDRYYGLDEDELYSIQIDLGLRCPDCEYLYEDCQCDRYNDYCDDDDCDEDY